MKHNLKPNRRGSKKLVRYIGKGLLLEIVLVLSVFVTQSYSQDDGLRQTPPTNSAKTLREACLHLAAETMPSGLVPKDSEIQTKLASLFEAYIKTRRYDLKPEFTTGWIHAYSSVHKDASKYDVPRNLMNKGERIGPLWDVHVAMLTHLSDKQLEDLEKNGILLPEIGFKMFFANVKYFFSLQPRKTLDWDKSTTEFLRRLTETKKLLEENLHENLSINSPENFGLLYAAMYFQCKKSVTLDKESLPEALPQINAIDRLVPFMGMRDHSELTIGASQEVLSSLGKDFCTAAEYAELITGSKIYSLDDLYHPKERSLAIAFNWYRVQKAIPLVGLDDLTAAVRSIMDAHATPYSKDNYSSLTTTVGNADLVTTFEHAAKRYAVERTDPRSWRYLATGVALMDCLIDGVHVDNEAERQVWREKSLASRTAAIIGDRKLIVSRPYFVRRAETFLFLCDEQLMAVNESIEKSRDQLRRLGQ